MVVVVVVVVIVAIVVVVAVVVVVVVLGSCQYELYRVRLTIAHAVEPPPPAAGT